MTTKEKILRRLQSAHPLSGKQLSRYLGVSRQALHVHLKELLATGAVVKTGSTRAAQYYPGDAAPAAVEFSKQLVLSATDENAVYEALAAALNLKTALKPNVESIAHYAFTEMLNNAIDHAQTERGTVSFALGRGAARFAVRDFGIGLFASIASKHGLADEHAAMLELVKGKTTTMPERHSGEGVFFTSRMADRFSIDSHRVGMVWDNDKNDVYVAQRRNLKGTLVQFSIKQTARRTLESVFSKHAPADHDYQFSKTSVLVKLLRAEFVSRSEAKRLTANLHRFREVTLDFHGVAWIGQGFADEVFRVYQNRHPRTLIRAINANKAVHTMLSHVNKA